MTRYDAPGDVRAMVLVLHGGKARSRAVVTGRSLTWQRALGLARSLGGPLHLEGVGVWVLRYRTVGWNGDGADKIDDAHWGLDRIRAEVGQVPVVLLGHSMGGRTACRSADHDLVRGVVALAPWLPPDEPVDALAGRALHAAHGRRDHITRARDTAAYVERARDVAREVVVHRHGGPRPLPAPRSRRLERRHAGRGTPGAGRGRPDAAYRRVPPESG